MTTVDIPRPGEGLSGPEFYAHADALRASGVGAPLPISFLCCAMPAPAPAWLTDSEPRRSEVLRTFFDITLTIFREALHGDQPKAVRHWLINDTATGLRRRYHLSLPDLAFAPPRFYRTDEGPQGKVVELQCPGSGWGDLQYLADLHRLTGTLEASSAYNPTNHIVADIQSLTGRIEPAVLHLLDNASAPASMQYLIRRSAPPLRYWGYSPGVAYRDCHFIRSHSFYGLVAENLFPRRLEAALAGDAVFDLPPICLFDQKAPLALPFWAATRDRYPEEVRKALVYSQPLTVDGFQSEDGQWVTLTELAKCVAAGRTYFIKYAGVDTTLNWGSRAVFRLAANPGEVLAKVHSALEHGRPWIIQPDISGWERTTYYERERANARARRLVAKYSRFYGPSGLIGARAMYSPSRKVHGQPDTVVGLVLS